MDLGASAEYFAACDDGRASAAEEIAELRQQLAKAERERDQYLSDYRRLAESWSGLDKESAALIRERNGYKSALEQIESAYTGVVIDRSAGEFKEIARKALTPAPTEVQRDV